MTANEVRLLLREACRRAGTITAWASANGISQAHVSDVLNGRRDPAQKILQALGLERVMDYRRQPIGRDVRQDAQ